MNELQLNFNSLFYSSHQIQSMGMMELSHYFTWEPQPKTPTAMMPFIDKMEYNQPYPLIVFVTRNYIQSTTLQNRLFYCHLIQINNQMGCTQSTVENHILSTKVNDERSRKLFEVISTDNLNALALLQAKEDFDANLAVSEETTQWSAVHLCCRFDAVCCLDFLLKRTYVANVKRYIGAVNARTSEGLSPLHLCGTWAAFKCFFLLLRYGGANLSALDGRSRTPQMAMRDSGLTEMAETLAALRTRHGHVAPWNPRLLHGLTDPSKLRSLQFHRQQFAALQGAEGTKETKAQLQHQDEAKLWNEKAKLENECDALFAKIKEKIENIQKEREKQATLAKKDAETVPQPPSVPLLPQEQKAEKTQQVLALQRRLQEKQKTISKLKEQLRRVKSERLEGLLQAQSRKVDSENPQTKESLSKFAAEFEAYKEQLRTNKSKYVHIPKVPIPVKDYRKGKEAQGGQGTQPGLSSQDPNLNLLPENVKQRYIAAKANGSFADQEFPHNESSFGGQKYKQDIKRRFPSVVWLRPTQFISPNFLLFDGIESNDIKQGGLGLCYFLATISELSRDPERVKELFAFFDTQIGFYVLRFYTNGKTNYVVLDDYFPCKPDTKQPLFARTNGKQIWVLLLQKAWSKIIGSYFSAEAMLPYHVMEDLSGAPTTITNIDQNPNLIKDLYTHSNKNRLIVVDSKAEKTEKDIVSRHAYSLLKVIEFNGAYIFKLRNPWGYFQWNGCYGEQSPQWTPELRKKCEQQNGEDGIFFLSQRELLSNFVDFNIELGEPNSKYSFIEFQSQPQQLLYFRFRVTKKGMMTVKVTQIFDRIIRDRDSQYKYSPLIFEMGRIVQNGVIWMSEGNSSCSYGAKSVFSCEQQYKEYEAGDYYVRLAVYWVNPKKYNSAVLSVYCGESVTIQRLQPTQGLKLWRQMVINRAQALQLTPLSSKNASYAMKWMKNHLVCFAVINQNAQGDCFKVRWSFDSKNFKLCRTGFNRVNESVLEFIVSKKQRYNFGTLDMTILNSASSSGSVSIEAIKAEMPKESIQSQLQQEQNRQLQLQRQRLKQQQASKQQSQQQQQKIKQQQQLLKQQQMQQQMQRQEQQRQLSLQKQQQLQRQQQQQMQKQEQQRQQALQKQQQNNKKQQSQSGLSTLPQQLKTLYSAAQSKGTFEDSQFPQQQSSLGDESHQEKLQPFANNIRWLRPSSFLDGKYTLFDGANPNDIRQGQLDTSYLLATLANYAQNPQKIENTFVFYDLEIGFFVLRFYTDGKPNFVVVDDYFPCDSSTNQPLFAFPVGNRLWTMLIEKAWAKKVGSYFAVQGILADPFMEDLGGGPTYGTYFEGLEDKTESLIEYAKKGYSVVLRSGSIDIEGMVADHDYSLLRVYQHKGSNIYKVRNPWGELEWNGDYGENSKRWTPQLRKTCDQKKGDDGVFFLSERELLQAFTYYSVGMDEPNFKYSFTEFRSKPQQSLYFRFKLTKKGNMAVRVTQPLKDMIKDEEYGYSSVVFELGKIENSTVTFYYEGQNQCSFGEKSVYISDNLYDEYEAGDYFVRVRVVWANPNKYNSAVLSVYCGESVAIERLKEGQGVKLWKQMIGKLMQDKELTEIDANVSYLMEWMKGQMVCYACINPKGAQANYKVSFTFNPADFANCKVGMGKVSEQRIEFVIDRKEGFNVGTVDIIQLGEECGQGSAQVQAQQL